MSFKLLAHNWIAHPLAGLLWYLGDRLASPTLEALGERVHALIFPPNDGSSERWQAEFNLVYYGRGNWSASDAANMSDEQLASTLEALHAALSAELKAAKKAGPPAPVEVRIAPNQVNVKLDSRPLAEGIAEALKASAKSVSRAVAIELDGREVARRQAIHNQALADRLGAVIPPFVDHSESRAAFHKWERVTSEEHFKPTEQNGNCE